MDILSRVEHSVEGHWSTQELKLAARQLQQELEECRQKYQALQEGNIGAIKQYKLEAKLIKREIRDMFDELSLLKEDLSARKDVVDIQSICEEETYDDYLFRIACKVARSAVIGSISEEPVDFNHVIIKPHAISLMKTLSEMNLSIRRKESVARLYAAAFARRHGDQLVELPQQAALFLNECLLLSTITGAEDVRLIGFFHFQKHVQCLLQEIDDFPSILQIDSVSIENLIMFVNRVLLSLERFQSVVRPVLIPSNEADTISASVCNRSMMYLSGHFCECIWLILSGSIGGILNEAIPKLTLILRDVTEFHDTCAPPSKSLTRARNRLHATSQLLNQPLLSWMKAFRSNKARLAPTEYEVMIKLLFADSSLRTSCLREISTTEHESSSEAEDAASTDGDQSE